MMSKVTTLAILILGGPFDETELSDNDVQINAKAADALQLERVTGQDDVHIELVERAEFDRVTAERDALQLRLNIADERAGELVFALRTALDATTKSQTERDHQIPGTSGMRLNMLANQGE